ncbi:MAG: oligopeptide transporter permease protein [Symbiobacteriaceae bacterium]|nr:oligopeptide transporter permease protein [Symbiobacteriaceae bacterium]
MPAAYVERIIRFAVAFLLAALLLFVLLNRTPGAAIDPGLSMRTGQPVAELVAPALTATLTSLAVNLAWALPLALLLGIPAGLRPHSLLDHVLQAPAVALMGVPAFVAALLAIWSLVFRHPGFPLLRATQVALVLLLAAWLARAVRGGLADSRTDGAQTAWGKAALFMLGRVLQQTGNFLVVTLLVDTTGGGPARGILGVLLQGAKARDIPAVYGALWAVIPVVLIAHVAGDLLVSAVGGQGERPGGRISRSWLVLGGLLAAVLLVMPMLGGDWQPDFLDVMQRNLPPGPGHPMGTDHLGRDLLARAAVGTRVSLSIAGASALLALLPAAMLATAGWAIGGWGMAIFTPRTAVPNLFLPLVAGLLGVLIMEQSVAALMFSFALASIPALTMAFRQLYRPDRTVAPLGRALPALFGVIILTVAQNLLAEITLSFMGFGVQPPMVSLGSIVSFAMPYLRTAPHGLFAVLPAVAGIAGLFLVGHSLAGPGRERI